jgi:sulfur carrier protein
MEAFSLVINGESRVFPASMTVSGLVEALDLTGKRVAVERNGEIVPRSRHADVQLESGDRLEIVVAVGGG